MEQKLDFLNLKNLININFVGVELLTDKRIRIICTDCLEEQIVSIHDFLTKKITCSCKKSSIRKFIIEENLLIKGF